MTALAYPDVFAYPDTFGLSSPTVRGPGRRRRVARRRAPMAWSDWVTLAPAAPRPSADLQAKARYLLDATGLSRRQLAEFMTITHPTLSALVDGRSTDLARSPQARQRLLDLHAVVRRLAPLTPEPPRLTALLTAQDSSGGSALSLLAAGQVAAAYAQALRQVAPPASDLLSSVFPKVSGSATSPLHD